MLKYRVIQDNLKVYSISLIPVIFFSFQIRSFQLEDSPDCSRDFLEVREGNATGHLVGRYCGNAVPHNYSSVVGHILWVRFVSDGSSSGTGFQAEFTKSKLVHVRNGFQNMSFKLVMGRKFSITHLARAVLNSLFLLPYWPCGITLLYKILEKLNYM
jgi:hypothetical protein